MYDQSLINTRPIWNSFFLVKVSHFGGYCMLQKVQLLIVDRHSFFPLRCRLLLTWTAGAKLELDFCFSNLITWVLQEVLRWGSGLLMEMNKLAEKSKCRDFFVTVYEFLVKTDILLNILRDWLVMCIHFTLATVNIIFNLSICSHVLNLDKLSLMSTDFVKRPVECRSFRRASAHAFQYRIKNNLPAIMFNSTVYLPLQNHFRWIYTLPFCKSQLCTVFFWQCEYFFLDFIFQMHNLQKRRKRSTKKWTRH